MSKRDLRTTLRAAGGFGTFVGLLQRSLIDALDAATEREPCTVFAPSDAAFEQLPREALELLENTSLRTDVLMHHLVPGRWTVAAIFPLGSPRAMQGELVEMRCIGARLFVDGVRVERADVECTNGVVHVVERLLSPRYGLLDPRATLVERWRRYVAWLEGVESSPRIHATDLRIDTRNRRES